MEEKTYIFEGKTTNEAIEKGLKQLKVRKNDVEVKILDEEEKKTFFSILAPKVVKIEMKIKEKKEESDISEKTFDETIEEIKNITEKFVNKLPTPGLTSEVFKEENIIKVNIKGDDISYLIGYRGETLNALQNILVNIASKDLKNKVKLILNVGEYRKKREEDLKKLANKIADSVVKTQRSVTLEPMAAFERKIIHTELQENEKVETHSVGNEPYRKVVITLK